MIVKYFVIGPQDLMYSYGTHNYHSVHWRSYWNDGKQRICPTALL